MTKTKKPTFTAFQEARAYEKEISGIVQSLKQDHAKLQQQIETYTAATTTAAALLNGSVALDDLKQAKTDYEVLTKRLEVIQERGGVRGLLQEDERMKELAARIYTDNIAALEALKGEKAALLDRFEALFCEFLQLGQEVEAHNATVMRLENEIDTYKSFMDGYGSGDLPTKTPFRYHEPKFPRSHSFIFKELERLAKDVRREGGAS
jgi:hypothetical protein